MKEKAWTLLATPYILMVLYFIFLIGMVITPEETVLKGKKLAFAERFPFDDFNCAGYMYTMYDQEHRMAACFDSWSYSKTTWLGLFVFEEKVTGHLRISVRFSKNRPIFHPSEIGAITHKDGSVFLPSQQGE